MSTYLTTALSEVNINIKQITNFIEKSYIKFQFSFFDNQLAGCCFIYFGHFFCISLGDDLFMFYI